ncbi:hypothetical protein V490_00952 [Pseudogymnoascus sp. VKM F-3557]|nr:hypothetical protein V490_00952 [Pseudogymnoascus sp. VKM F-3557]
MGNKSGDKQLFDSVKGFPYNDLVSPQDSSEPSYQQPPASTNSSKISFKKLFKRSGKSDESAKPGKPVKPNKPDKADNADDKNKATWAYPQNLAAPAPMDIYKIMVSSPEHQARLASEKAKKEVDLRRQANASTAGHSEISESVESTVIPHTADMKWSFDGKSFIEHKRPLESPYHHQHHQHNQHLREPGTMPPQGMWTDHTANPQAVYQREMMPGMRNEFSAPTNRPAISSNEQGYGVLGASLPDGNPPQEFYEPPRKVYEPPEPPYRPIDMSNLRTPYEIAEAAYVYGIKGSKKDWLVYLNDYRRGVFNIMNPPKPPAIAPLFSYLPAMDPPNEAGRLSSLFSISRVWTPVQEDRSKEIVKASMAEFEATGVSISLIDNSNEIFKAEIGYNRRMIQRSISLGAHVLLSTEVLVVLDTEKDWRFAKNPLVLDGPKIRFFAGAPILSQNCEVVGVFAIFGRQPRRSFSALLRRSLTDYGAICARELNTVMDKSISEGDLQPLISQANAVMEKSPSQQTLQPSQANTELWDPTYLPDEPKPQGRNLWMHEETHRMLCGEPEEEEEDQTKYPTTFAELMEQIAIQNKEEDEALSSDKKVATSYLNPYASAAQASSTYSSIDVNFSTPAKDRDTVVSDYPLLGIENESPPLRGFTPRSESPDSGAFQWRPESPKGFTMRPESPVMRSCTPRPYSGSDLTSVDGNLHPNTPTEREVGGSSSSQRVQDVLDRTASVLKSEAPERPLWRQRKKSIRSISKYEAELKSNLERELREAHDKAAQVADSDSTAATAATASFNTPELPSTQATTPLTSFTTRMSTLEFADTHRRPDADAAAMSIAKKLNFDRVYVAELVPGNSVMTPDGQAVASVDVRILASYNCPPDMELGPDFHLEVLRSPLGAISWSDADALPGASNKGLFIRLHSKGPYGVPRQQHTGGIVYAALHTTPFKDGEATEITDQEQAALVDAANEMKLILFKKGYKRERKESASGVDGNASSHTGDHGTTAPAA